VGGGRWWWFPVVLRFQSREVEVRWFVPTSWSFFLFFLFLFCNYVLFVSRYKKPYAALAMKRKKPINANPPPASPHHGKNQTPWVHRKSLPLLAPSVRCGAGRGGFSRARPRPYTGPGGGMFQVIPAPPLSGGRPHWFPGRGPVCYHLFLTGTRLGSAWGGGLSGDRGRECRKRHPAPGRWVGRGGEKGRGPAFFGALSAP